jgi:hypothetical protein
MKRSAAITALVCAVLTGRASTARAQEAPATSHAPAAGSPASEEPAPGAGPAGADRDVGSADSADSADDADDSSVDERDYGERRQGDERDLQYAWKTAGQRRAVPLAFVSLHGHVQGVFGAPSRDWAAPDPTQVGAPGQLLVPNTGDSSFQYDAALFVSTDISAHTRALLELHLVADPGGQGEAGPGGLTLAVTEASASWDIYESYFTLGGGLFWSPFGIVNDDWLGSEALFLLLPRASAAFPAHFNERGVRVDGSRALGKGFGINYVVSVGNGVSSFDIDGQGAFDRDSGKTVTSRVGVFPGLGPDLALGASFAAGTLRERGDDTAPAGDVRRYSGAFTALGGDLVWLLGDLELRSYYIRSAEALGAGGGVSPPDITRQGFMAEASYRLGVALPLGNVRAIVPKARFDWVSVDVLDATGAGATNLQTGVYSVGVDVRSAGAVGAVLSLEYHVQDEIKGFATPLDNDRFVARLLARF